MLDSLDGLDGELPLDSMEWLDELEELVEPDELELLDVLELLDTLDNQPELAELHDWLLQELELLDALLKLSPPELLLELDPNNSGLHELSNALFQVVPVCQ